MDYNTLINDLLALDPHDVQGMHRLSRLLSDLSDPATMRLINSIQDFDKIIANINALDNVTIIPPDTKTQRGRFVDRTERLSGCEGKTIPVKGTITPEPYFQKFDLILCHFGGVGWEYDGPHYALVWEDDHNDSEITVIPTTSQFSKEYAHEFSIGIISGLPPKKTILSVKKMIRISRKRVINHRTHYVQGQVHPKLHSLVRERIENALAIWLYGEVALDFYVRNETNVALPVNFLTHYPQLRFMPIRDVTWDRPNLVLHYRKWNECTMNSLQMKNPTTFVKVSHKKYAIYDPIFSSDPKNVAAATAEFNRLY